MPISETGLWLPDPKKVLPIVPFLETFYVLPGSEDQKPVRLFPHQKAILERVFTLDEHGRLPFKQFVFSCPKKSAKTELGAMIATWFAFSGLISKNGEVYCCLSPGTKIPLTSTKQGTLCEMVNNRYSGEVLSWDAEQGKRVSKKVKNWFRTPRGNRRYLDIVTPVGQVQLTDDHRVYTQRGQIESGELTLLDKIATSYYDLTTLQHDIVIGCLLGDGSISLPKKHKRARGKHASFRVGHCNKQAEYLYLKANACSNLGSTLVSEKREHSIRGRKIQKSLEHLFFSTTSPVWTTLFNEWYPDNKKIVPRSLKLNPRSLAVWFLDDGTRSATNNTGALATDCFVKEDVEFLSQLLREQFGIENKPSLVKKENVWRIIISVAGMMRLTEIIAPHVPPCMRYKLSSRAKPWKRKMVIEPASFDISLWTETQKYPQYFTPISAIRRPKVNRNTLYCIEVEDTHNFYAGRLLVSNCSNDLEQSIGRHFKAIKSAIESSKPLRSLCDKIYDKNIVLKNGTTISALASDWAGSAGANQNLSLFDELWGARSEGSRRLFEEMTPPPTRENAMRIVTSYSGFTQESVLLEDIYDQVVKPENQISLGSYMNYETEQETEIPVYVSGDSFVYWDHEPRMPWQNKEYYISEMNQPGFRMSAFLRIHRNLWQGSSEGLEMKEWDSCVDLAIERNYKFESGVVTMNGELVGRQRELPIAVGIDASTVKDRTAIVTAYKKDGLLWLGPYKMWQPDKDNPLNFETTIEAYIEDLASRYFISVCTYDPWQMESTAQRLRAQGVNMIPWPQTQPNTILMTELVLDKLRQQGIVIYPNDDLRNEARMISIKEVIGRGRRFVKDNKNKKIDSIIAMSMAMLGAERYCPDFESLGDQIMMLRLNRNRE